MKQKLMDLLSKLDILGRLKSLLSLLSLSSKASLILGIIAGYILRTPISLALGIVKAALSLIKLLLKI